MHLPLWGITEMSFGACRDNRGGKLAGGVQTKGQLLHCIPSFFYLPNSTTTIPLFYSIVSDNEVNPL